MGMPVKLAREVQPRLVSGAEARGGRGRLWVRLRGASPRSGTRSGPRGCLQGDIAEGEDEGKAGTPVGPVARETAA